MLANAVWPMPSDVPFCVATAPLLSVSVPTSPGPTPLVITLRLPMARVESAPSTVMVPLVVLPMVRLEVVEKSAPPSTV